MLTCQLQLSKYMIILFMNSNCFREQADFTQKWKDMAFSDENNNDIRPVYAPKDFMEVHN